jgi:benzoate transport
MNDIRQAILTQPMRWFQIRVIIICIILAMIDGYEILVMAFVAPHLAKAWSLEPVQVGYLLSAGIFGMAIGATFISPLADRIGRRRHILICLALITIGMALSAVAQNLGQMVCLRAFAGLFIGAIMSSLNVIVSEYCSERRRGTAMGIYGIGLPAGVALGGAVTGVLIASFGWRSPFLFSAIITGLTLVAVAIAVPESIDYLVEKRPAGALAQYNRIAAKLGYAQARELPAAQVSHGSGIVWKALFGGVMLKRSIFLWLGYACMTAAFYFANTWTAKMIADATGDASLGGTTAVLIAVGGVIGALIFAALSTIMRPRLVTALIMFAGALAYVLYANYFQTLTLALSLAVMVGICANGGMAAFYAISPSIYPAAVRGTGVGLMIGFGRGVAILVPIFTGYLLKAGWTPQLAYQVFGGVLLCSGLLTFLLDRTYAKDTGRMLATAQRSA